MSQRIPIRVLVKRLTVTTQIWIMTRHQYGIYALDPQTSFRGETVGGVQKCRLIFQATTRAVNRELQHPEKRKAIF